MANPAFTIAKGEGGASKILKAVLKDDTGSRVNLTGGTVVFKLSDWATNTALSLGGTASIVTAASGVVQYQWATADTATSGNYFGQFVFTAGDGTVTKYPNDNDRLWIAITPAA